MKNGKLYTLYQMIIDNIMWETTCRPLSIFSDLADANEELVDNMVELRKEGYTDAFGTTIPSVTRYMPDNSKVVNDFYAMEKGDRILVHFVAESPVL